MYVLETKQKTFFVEYHTDTISLCSSIEEALVFKEFGNAKKFKDMLFENYDLFTSIKILSIDKYWFSSFLR